MGEVCRLVRELTVSYLHVVAYGQSICSNGDPAGRSRRRARRAGHFAAISIDPTVTPVEPR